MPEELTLLPCPLCQARAHVECHNGKFRVICKGESGCPFRMGGKWFVFPDECYDWWNAFPRTLEWTDEPPKVPGWYWCRDAEGEIRLCQLENFVGGPRLFICGISKHTFPDELTGIQWAGPIPEPREPKEQGGYDG